MQASIHTLLRRGEDGTASKGRGAVRQKVVSTWKRGAITLASLLLGLTLFVAPAAAQSGVCPEGADPAPAIQRVVALLERLQELGVAIGLAAAALGYLYAGFLLMKGTPQAVERAKHVAAHVTVGLAIILVSGGLVEVIKRPLCGG